MTSIGRPRVPRFFCLVCLTDRFPVNETRMIPRHETGLEKTVELAVKVSEKRGKYCF